MGIPELTGCTVFPWEFARLPNPTRRGGILGSLALSPRDFAGDITKPHETPGSLAHFRGELREPAGPFTQAIVPGDTQPGNRSGIR
jgi:hypothetical protein